MAFYANYILVVASVSATELLILCIEYHVNLAFKASFYFLGVSDTEELEIDASVNKGRY
jgi:hypothetical protein